MPNVILLLVLMLSPVSALAQTPDKWEGYLEFTGKPGSTRSTGISDLFVPLWQDKNNLSFFNIRGMTESFDDGDFNIGIGHRHQFGKYILGAYGYYDGSESDKGIYYHQWSTGLEFLSEKWDFRVNGYIADQTVKEVSYDKVDTEDFSIKIDEGKVWTDYTRWEHWEEERASSGFDMEVGYKLPVFEDTRLYLGGYYFAGQHGFENVTGPRVRLETRLYDLPYMGPGSRLMAGIETQSDEVRGGQTTGMISIRIPFGAVSKKERTVLTGLDRRMVEPVVKNTNIITTQKERTLFRSARSSLYNPEGLEYTKLVRTTPEYDIQEIMDNTQALIDAEGVLPLVIIDGAIEIDADSVEVIGGATFAFAGQSLELNYRNAFDNTFEKVSFTPEGTTPILVLTGEYDSGWGLKLADRAHINGWNIDATDYDDGIRLLEEGGKYYITNSTIYNAKDNNIQLSQGTLYVDELKLYGSDVGVLMAKNGKLRGVEGTAGTIGKFSGEHDDEYWTAVISFANNLEDTVLTDTVATLQESHAQVAGVTVDAWGYSNGILANAAGTYFVTNTTVINAAESKGYFKGREGRGFVASGDKTFLYVTNSKAHSNSQEGFRVMEGATMILDHIEVYNNNESGIFVGGDGDEDKEVLANGGNLIATNSLFYGNKEGLSAANGFNSIHISKSKFFNNLEEGLDVSHGSSVIIEDSEIYNNNFGVVSGSAGAGGVYIANIKDGATIKDTTIRDNNGGVFVETDLDYEDEPVTVSLDNVTIIRNGTNAVVSRGESTVNIKKSTLDGNCSLVLEDGHTGVITVDDIVIESGLCP